MTIDNLQILWNKQKGVTQDINRLNKKKCEFYIDQSYRLVFEKLTKKEQTILLEK